MNNNRHFEAKSIVRRTLESFARDYYKIESQTGKDDCDRAAYEFISVAVDKRDQTEYQQFYDKHKEAER